MMMRQQLWLLRNHHHPSRSGVLPLSSVSSLLSRPSSSLSLSSSSSYPLRLSRPRRHVQCTITSRSCFFFSDWTGARGYDLTHDSASTSRTGQIYGPKVIVQGYGPTGFDVMNVLKKVDPNEKSKNDGGILHMNGSILVFPHGCFLWNVSTPQDVTLQSLAPIVLHKKPSPIEYLFIGTRNSNSRMRDEEIPDFDRIQDFFRKRKIVVERMNLTNAIGTFNILNAEDRQVAAALILDPNEEEEED